MNTKSVETIIDELDMAGPLATLAVLQDLLDTLIDAAGPLDERARFMSGYISGRSGTVGPHVAELIASDDAWAEGWAAGRMMAGDRSWITCH